MNSGTPVEHLATETVLHANGVRSTNFSRQEVQQGLQLIQMSRAAVAEKIQVETSSSSTGY